MNTQQAGLVALVIFAWFAASAIFRIMRRRPIFASRSLQAVFVERWASARFGSGMLARLATAKNCLQVQVVADEVIVTPHFPFTLGFLAEVYGYDQRIPLSAIKSAQVVGGRMAQVVEVQYSRSPSEPAVAQFLLRRAPAFIAALRSHTVAA